MAARTFDTGTDPLLCALADGVATITLNRPDKRNALSDELTPALRQTLLGVDADPEVRCIRTDDHQQAVQAFLSKRRPSFGGR